MTKSNYFIPYCASNIRKHCIQHKSITNHVYVILFLAVGEEVWKSDESPAYPVGGPSSGNERPTYTGTYMIARLKPATVYMARVSSQNSYGYSHPSQVFKFATRGAGKQHKTLLIVTLHLNFENNFESAIINFES